MRSGGMISNQELLPCQSALVSRRSWGHHLQMCGQQSLNCQTGNLISKCTPGLVSDTISRSENSVTFGFGRFEPQSWTTITPTLDAANSGFVRSLQRCFQKQRSALFLVAWHLLLIALVTTSKALVITRVALVTNSLENMQPTNPMEPECTIWISQTLLDGSSRTLLCDAVGHSCVTFFQDASFRYSCGDTLLRDTLRCLTPKGEPICTKRPLRYS